MKNVKSIIILILLSFLLNYGSSIADAETLTATIRADLTTGTNRHMGKPVYDFGEPLGTAGFFSVFGYNPNGNEPVALMPDTPLDTLIATGVDPWFLSFFGMTPDDVDPNLINLPIREVPVTLDRAGLVREYVPGIQEAEQRDVYQVGPTNSITLRDWLKAEGIARVRCNDDFSSITLKLSSLIPNRMYTLWAVFGGETIAARPLGGVPNIIITDRHGDARFERELNFCPLKVKEGEVPMLMIDVLYHSDHQMYGGVPDLPLVGLHGGIVAHTQLEFLFMGERISDQE